MRLRAKFTLLLSVAFLAALAVMGLIAHAILQRNAEQEIAERASLMLEAAKAMRAYTIENVKPAIGPLGNDVFHPETVPAFGAMTVFDFLRKEHPAYTYREAALNPTNPRSRAVDWEADLISHFRNFPDAKELSGTRDTPSGRVMYIARPIRITNQACLDCHTTPAQTPPAVVKRYGEHNGYGWTMNEVVAAQIVAVPASLSLERANRTFLVFMASVTAAGMLGLLVLHFALGRMVVQPVARLSEWCDQVSAGDFTAEDPDTGRGDEIGSLGRSFARMKISLQKAMSMLDG